MAKLSIIILARNVEKEIIPALKTSKFADEIIVVDTGSNDNTLKVAKPYATKIIKSSGQDFARWRNEGAREAKGEWLLYLDSDERISKDLAGEILATLVEPIHDAYTIPRWDIMLGKHLKHWPHSHVLRLIKKKSLVKWHHKLHEQPEITGTIGSLKNHITHLTHKNFNEKVTNTLEWSLLEAEMLKADNHPKMRWWRFWRIMFTEFWSRAIKQGLWKDGVEGHLEIIYQTFSRFLTYARLWELQHDPSLEKTYKQIDKKILDEWKQ